eukprot:4432441-Prymnesium_polylepis.1
MELAAVAAASVTMGAWLAAVPRRAQQEEGDLRRAAQDGRTAELDALVAELGLRVDAPGESGETALILAAAEGRAESVQTLLSLGASTAAHTTAAVSGLDAGAVAAHAAAARGHAAVLAVLLEADTSAVRALDASGATPLHAACRHAHPAAAELMLRMGAEVDAVRTVGGATPLGLAAATGCVEAVQLCLQHSAAVGAADADGNTPLHRACAFMQVGAAQCLLAAGASLHALNRKGVAPLELAYRPGHGAMGELTALCNGCLAARLAEGKEEARMARAARERLEARLARVAREEPSSLEELLQDEAVRRLVLRLRADLSCLPAPALRAACSPQTVEWIAELQALVGTVATDTDSVEDPEAARARAEDAVDDARAAADGEVPEQLRQLTALVDEAATNVLREEEPDEGWR